ncbi:MAG: phosphoribosylglycinamide formyltransferase [Bacteroidales bacterium]|jgi:phosphoribosylglycinamide formyltransferase-1|nr:phosphoribosylglycinamide formyltransferase [Bacteroidales bacterium]MDD3273755.1 phosphoribosylglycinamide formyltransferase [Bacteroidales bacterium]MDD4057920.1 phosphoribosylglycinamide formyltransferase [Bacteroidales bacterium]
MCQINIAIFASGSGTNAENLIKFFSGSKHIKIAVVMSNKNDAYVLERARKFGIPTYTFTSSELSSTSLVDQMLDSYKIEAIVLAGFLLKIPERILQILPDRILNIHPALLPKFGGKGMYGMNVHKAVIEAGEIESGITIHLVDGKYDNGVTLFQAKCEIGKNETPESLAEKIHKLEYSNFPKVVNEYLMNLL